MELVYSLKDLSVSNQLTMRYHPRVSFLAEPTLAAQNNSRSTNKIFLAAIVEDEKTDAIAHSWREC